MKIRLGYVSISKALNITSSHTITYTNYKKLNPKQANEKLTQIITRNLDNLEEILKYNTKNNIHFYRMTSALFPLQTHKEVKYDALKIFKTRLKNIGKIINENNMRVGIHLDSFCVLGSAKENVVTSTINIIKFYKNMLKAMNLKTYMILHLGSNKEGKQKSKERFINNFKKLDKESKELIILENDDKIFNITDILEVCKRLKIPMVLDYHHYKCNNEEDLEYYIEDILKTWGNKIPKIHISSPKSKKEFRSHHDYINVDEFIELINMIKIVNKDIDIMIEAKEKDNALFKLIRELKYRGYKFIDDTTLEL